MGNRNGAPILENFVYGDTPGYDSILQVLKSIRDTRENLDADCGRFSVRLDSSPIRLPSSELPSLDGVDFFSLMKPLVKMAPSPLSIDLATRFLYGISIPRLIQIKAKQLNGFGQLESYPYKRVESWTKSNLRLDQEPCEKRNLLY